MVSCAVLLSQQTVGNLANVANNRSDVDKHSSQTFIALGGPVWEAQAGSTLDTVDEQWLGYSFPPVESALIVQLSN